MWVEFAVSCRPCAEGFSPGSSPFPPSTKTNTPNSNSIPKWGPQVCQLGCYVSPSLNKVYYHYYYHYHIIIIITIIIIFIIIFIIIIIIIIIVVVVAAIFLKHSGSLKIISAMEQSILENGCFIIYCFMNKCKIMKTSTKKIALCQRLV